MDFDDESEEEVGTNESDLEIKYNSKKSAFWSFFLKTKRRHPTKTKMFLLGADFVLSLHSPSELSSAS